jgi:hypothetical protein
MPLYRGISPLLIFGLLSCVCSSSLTRSIGATTVLLIAPATPPAARSFVKLSALFATGGTSCRKQEDRYYVQAAIANR